MSDGQNQAAATVPAANTPAPATGGQTHSAGGSPSPAAPQTEAVQPDWRDDWRDKLEPNDPAARKLLDRVSDPPQVWKNYLELQKKMSGAEYRVQLPENPTPEQLADWRKDMGIPDKPEAYDLKPDGYVIGDADKPIWDDVKKAMHDKNATPAELNRMAEMYYQVKEKQEAARAEMDVNDRVEFEMAIAKAWGADSKINQALITNTFSRFPAIKEAIHSMRLQNGAGKFAAYDANLMLELGALARELNPAATIVPAGSDPVRSTTDRLVELRSMQANSESDYWKGAKTADGKTVLQAEYEKLLEAQDKLKSRQAA